jgi:hypothetical protein
VFSGPSTFLSDAYGISFSEGRAYQSAPFSVHLKMPGYLPPLFHTPSRHDT